MQYLFKTTVCVCPASKSFIPPNLRYVIKVGFFNEGVQVVYFPPSQRKYQSLKKSGKQNKKKLKKKKNKQDKANR